MDWKHLDQLNDRGRDEERLVALRVIAEQLERIADATNPKTLYELVDSIIVDHR